MDHLAGTLGTEKRGRATGYVRCRRRGMRGLFDSLRAVGLQWLFDNGEAVPLLGMQQAVGPHLLEAAWQHVLEEPADELLGGQRGGLSRIGLGVTVAECDLAVFESEEVAVADGDAKDIRGQVLQGGLAAAHRDDIHDPVLVPDLRWDLVKQAGLLEQVRNLARKIWARGFSGKR